MAPWKLPPFDPLTSLISYSNYVAFSIIIGFWQSIICVPMELKKFAAYLSVTPSL
jgi:hypothetical protein